MLVGKEGVKIFPHLVGQRLQVPESTGVGEIPGQEYQVLGGGCNLIGGEWDSSGVGKADGSFDLVIIVLNGLLMSYTDVIGAELSFRYVGLIL